jgi:hypothetical protein
VWRRGNIGPRLHISVLEQGMCLPSAAASFFCWQQAKCPLYWQTVHSQCCFVCHKSHGERRSAQLVPALTKQNCLTDILIIVQYKVCQRCCSCGLTCLQPQNGHVIARSTIVIARCTIVIARCTIVIARCTIVIQLCFKTVECTAL